jgi:hypothetical protein
MTIARIIDSNSDIKHIPVVGVCSNDEFRPTAARTDAIQLRRRIRDDGLYECDSLDDSTLEWNEIAAGEKLPAPTQHRVQWNRVEEKVSA